MSRLILVMLLVVLAGSVAQATDLTDRWGAGLNLGIMKPIGGDNDYATMDQVLGLTVRRGFTPNWAGEFGLRYAVTRPGAKFPGDQAGMSFDSSHAFQTTFVNPTVGARYTFLPEAEATPFAVLSLGVMSWAVHDENGNESVGLFPSGDTVEGYDENGELQELSGTNLTLTATLAVECFLGETFAMETGARYTHLLGNDLDTVGMSRYWGPDHTDANVGVFEVFLGGVYYLD